MDALIAELVMHLKNPDIEALPREGLDMSASGQTTSNLTAPELQDSRLVSCCKKVEVEDPGLAASRPLERLEEQLEGCKACRLWETRNKLVFGEGNELEPLIAFVGEGPGADEDRQGRPFVGRAGQLLSAAIEKGLGLRREDLYICNVVKCRCPNNRNPLPDEVKACLPNLLRQLELIRPGVIISLGAPALCALSGAKEAITKVRGEWRAWRGIDWMPTFHPAYILRNPPSKRLFWEDLKAVMGRLGL